MAPVHFHQTILKLHDQGVRLFIEAGPGNKLTGFVDDALRGRPHLAVSASSRTRPDLLQLQLLAAELFAHGCVPPVDVWELLLRMPSGSAALHPKSPPAARAYSSTSAWKQQAPGATTIVDSHQSLLAEMHASELRVLERFQRSMGSLSVPPRPAPYRLAASSLSRNGEPPAARWHFAAVSIWRVTRCLLTTASDEACLPVFPSDCRWRLCHLP